MRRNLYTFFFLSLSLVGFAQTTPQLKSGSKFSLSCANVSMEIDSASGARITSFKVEGTELINQNGANLTQIGSTFWPSPQEGWGSTWPPLAALDNLSYSVKIEGSAITFTGGIEPKTLLRFKKKIYANPADTSIIVEYTMINENETAKTWAPWEITRVACNGLTIFKKGDSSPTGPLATSQSVIPSGSSYAPLRSRNGYIWYNQDICNVTTGGGEKLNCDGRGWLAHVVDKNRILLKRFEDIPLASAAPKEAEVQLYTAQGNAYTEIENQGAYVSIPAHDSVTWTVRWYGKVIPLSSASVNVGVLKFQAYMEDIVARGDQAYAGIGEQASISTNIYPNPAKDVLMVQTNFSSYSNVELLVYDLQGRLALRQWIKNPQQQVSVKGLAVGSYLYQINTGTSSVAKGKFLINR